MALSTAQMSPEVEIPAHVSRERVVDFDMYCLPEGKKGFHEAWKTLQAPGIPDIVWTPRNGGHWIATRGKVIHEVFGDFENFSNHCILVPKEVGLQHKLLPSTLDPPEHRPFRILLNTGLAPKRIHGLREQIRQLAAELIDEVRLEGQCNFTTVYAEQLPIRIFLLIVDMPLEDAPKMKYWADQITRPDGTMTLPEAVAAFGDYLAPYIKQRMASPGEDMLSHMVSGQIDGRPLTFYEAQQLSVQLLIAGLDTVVNFLGYMMLYLAQNPQQRQLLVDDPSLIPAATEELFRRFPLVCIGRLVKRDMVFHGVKLKAGEMILVPSPLHGTDEREHECPMAVDFKRKDVSHSTFGNGPHRCPGAHLARTEVIITIEEWLARIPEFSIAPGAEIVYKGGIVGCIEAVPLVWDPAKTRTGSTASSQ